MDKDSGNKEGNGHTKLNSLSSKRFVEIFGRQWRGLGDFNKWIESFWKLFI